MKKVLIFVLLLAGMAGGARAQTVTVSVPDTTLPPGRQLVLPVSISDLSGLGVLSLDAILSFDTSILRFDSLTATSGTDPDLQNNLVVNFKDEKLYVSGGSVQGLKGGGVLFTFYFWIDSSVPVNSQTPVLLNSFVLNEGTPATTLKSGSVKIIRDTVPPKIVFGPKAKEVSDRAIQISWKTDEPTKGEIDFGTGTSYGEKKEDSGWTYSHSFVLKELVPGQIYHYRISATDRFGNGPTRSDDQTFTTSPLRIRGAQFAVALAETLDVPIFVPSLNGLNVTKLSFDVAFDPQKITPLSAISDQALTRNWGALQSNANGSVFHVAGQGNSALEGEGILLWLRIKILPSVSAGTKLTLNFNAFQFNNGSPPAKTFPIQLEFLARGGGTQPLLALPVSRLLPAAVADLPVELTGNQNRGIFSIHGKIILSNTHVTIVGVGRQNAAVDSCDKFVYDLSDTSLEFWVAHSHPLNDEGKLFDLRVAVGAETHEGDSTAVRFRELKFNGKFPASRKQDGVVRIYERHDFISGFVRDKEDSSAISGATVSATEAGSGKVMSLQTNDLGFYQFSGLDTSKRYNLRAAKQGYTALAEQKNVKPGTKEVNFYLLKENGAIDGTVTTTSGEAIFGVFVVADDGHGHLGSANTDSTGHFSIRHLAKVYPYRLTCTKFGFKNKIVSGISVNKTVSVHMQWNYGHVYGTTRDTTNAPMDGVWVKALNLKRGVVSDSALTGKKGTFRIDSLVTGQYLLYVQKKGFVGAPAQVTISLAPGDSSEVNFTLEKAILASLKISGKAEIPNNQPTHFDYVARTSGGRLLNLESPVWTLTPAGAGKVTNGTVYPKADYFGEALLSVRDPGSGIADTVSLSIYTPVEPATEASIQNEDGVTLTISAGAVTAPQKIKILTVSLPSIKKSTEKYAAIGKAFALKPEGYKFARPLHLEMPVPPGFDAGRVVIGKWNRESAKWEPIATTAVGKNRVAANVTSFSLISVLQPARNLGMESLALRPNPFSPELDSDKDGYPGLTIAFRVTSRDSRMPFVTVQIFDMLGQKIRTVVNREPVNKEQQLRFHWDGKTDDGLLVRNGRYIVKVDVSDATGTKSVIKTVVMVK